MPGRFWHSNRKKFDHDRTRNHANDVSDSALYVEDRWREPFAALRNEAPVSWRAESPYGGY